MTLLSDDFQAGVILDDKNGPYDVYYSPKIDNLNFVFLNQKSSQNSVLVGYNIFLPNAKSKQERSRPACGSTFDRIIRFTYSRSEKQTTGNICIHLNNTHGTQHERV
jgi:hypothetical protein